MICRIGIWHVMIWKYMKISHIYAMTCFHHDLGTNKTSDDYYPTVAINALMRILREPGLSQHHNKVIQAVMFIIKSLNVKCVPFLPQILPPFLHVMRTNEESLREFLFNQLGRDDEVCHVHHLVWDHVSFIHLAT